LTECEGAARNQIVISVQPAFERGSAAGMELPPDAQALARPYGPEEFRCQHCYLPIDTSVLAESLQDRVNQ
jgi:hypothetical protein